MAYATTSNTNVSDNSELKRIDLTALRRQRFLIDLGDGNEDRILEINTTDMGVVNRLSDGYNRLIELDILATQLSDIDTNISDSDSDDIVKGKLLTFSDKLKEIDSKMREVLDFIFDTNVSEVCCPFGSMYDPVGGKLRYEYIIETLMTLYSESLAKEMAKTAKRVKSHTAKYTNK